uniref:Fibronectin type-III domain-containing protein n=1 Tax=Meloidogyne hapla TaxID=6305 RepID=A0A1I8B6Q1_MELHA
MFNYLILIIFILFELINAEINIRPPGIGKNNSIYILSLNSPLQLDCEVEYGDFSDIEDINALEWVRGKMKIGHNWLSMYTQPKIDEKRRWLRQSLYIPKITEQNSGEYKCLFFDDLQKTINLFILKNLEWKTKINKIGAPIGQPLTINCGAENIPDEAIQILDSKGRAIEEVLDDNEVLVTGAEITLPKLGKEHKGLKIRCVAIRPISLKNLGLSEDLDNSVDSVHTDELELIIDVWIPPKFDDHFSSSNHRHYAIPGSKQLLRWTIIESNPPVKIWTLNKDGEIFLEKERIKIIQKLNETKPFFAILIENVQDEDYGRYTLTAHNGILESQQTQTLIITQPPSQPKVFVDWVSSNGSVSWRIEEQQQNKNQLNVAYFWINITKSNNKIETTTISIQTYRVRRRKNLNNLYEIAGLEPFTEYEFIFVAGNQAGESDPLSFNLAIIDKRNDRESDKNFGINSTKNNKINLNYFLFLIIIFYLII